MKEKYGYSKYFRSLQIFADFAFLNFFYFYVLEYIGFEDGFNTRTVIDLNLLWAVSVLVVNPYLVYRHSGFLKLIKKQMMVLGLFMSLLSIFITYFFGISEFGAIRYIKILLAFAILFLFWKFLLILLISWYRQLGMNRRNFIVIGSGEMVEDFVHELTKKRALGYHHLQSIPVTKKDKKAEFFDKISKALQEKNPHIAYISLPSIRESFLNELVSKLEDERVAVRIILDFKSSMARKGELEFIDYIPVLNFSSDPLDSFALYTYKRIFDVVFSALTIVALIPVYIAVGLITALTSKGPVFYRQERVGRKGKSFSIYKFRSMYIDAEHNGPALSSDNDDRITPWGKVMRKYRLDEIPQFFNVLMGSMSVVGPRPEREFWKLRIEEESPKFNRLTYVKPGITSLGQVKFGYAENVIEMRKRLRYDLLYLNNMSIWMDLKIIGMTVLVILRGEGK